MKKLRLEIDALAVESFATAETPEAAGTVRGHGPNDTAPANYTCGAELSCGPYTCGAAFCVKDTDNYHCGTGAVTCMGCGTGGGCGTGTGPSGQMSCIGCRTYDFTAGGGDSCDFCLSRYTDSPQYCPCI